jgi:hypothetical protein
MSARAEMPARGGSFIGWQGQPCGGHTKRRSASGPVFANGQFANRLMPRRIDEWHSVLGLSPRKQRLRPTHDRSASRAGRSRRRQRPQMDAMNDLKETYGDLLWLVHLDMTDTPEIRRVVNKAFADPRQDRRHRQQQGWIWTLRRGGRAERRTDRAPTLHQSARPDPVSARGIAPPARARRRPDYRPLHLWRPGGSSWGSLHHASKWGLEGFPDSMTQELAPFKNGVTIVEPGGARTNFRFGGAQLGAQMEALSGHSGRHGSHDDQGTSRLSPGDPAKMPAVIIDSVNQAAMPGGSSRGLWRIA